MRVLRPFLFFFASIVGLMAPTVTPAQQLWSGILDTTHGADWTRAGAQNNHSQGWTQCGTTIAPYSGSAATINSALSSCGANQYVLLGSGTFNLSSGITIGKSNVALRGSGADQTLLVFGSGASSGCNGLGALVCIQGPNVSAGSNPAGTNWAAGYAQGGNQITLASASGVTPNQTMLILDQCDDGTTGVPCSGTVTDNGGFFVCSASYSSSGPSGCAGEAPSNAYRTLRSQIQMTYATAVSGNTVTIADPVVAPNWRSSQSPQVWLYSPVVNSGIENLSVDGTSANQDGIKFYGCMNCWVAGNRIVNPNKRAITLFESAHVDVQENYSYGAQNSDPYCISPDYTSFLKIENNIIQRCRSTIVYEGPDVGTVVAYNLSIGDWDGGTSYMWFSLWTHSSASMYNLYEGNIGNGIVFDNIHGSHQMNTIFRDYYSGWEPGKNTQTNAVYSAAFARYTHIIGSVLGHSGYHSAYQSQTATSSAIIVLGAGGDSNGVPVDPKVLGTSMRWGNYDTVNAAVRWVASEVPALDPLLPNLVPLTQSLPPSFYLASKPSWWGSEPWPPIGPDVSSGTVYGSGGSTTWASQSVAGHANNTPALDCYKNVMGGPADGSGGVLTFSAGTCYGGGVISSGPPPTPPTGLTATVN